MQIAYTSPEGLKWLALLAMASARKPFFRMPAILASIKKYGRESPALFATRKDGYTRLNEVVGDWWEELGYWLTDPKGAEEEAFRTFLTLPGLGPAKAGFLVQLTLGEGGCLDAHNLKRYQVDLPVLPPGDRKDMKGKKAERYDRVVKEYLELCRGIGTSEFLWNEWCKMVAKRWPGYFRTPGHVSRYHWASLPIT